MAVRHHKMVRFSKNNQLEKGFYLGSRSPSWLLNNNFFNPNCYCDVKKVTLFNGTNATFVYYGKMSIGAIAKNWAHSQALIPPIISHNQIQRWVLTTISLRNIGTEFFYRRDARHLFLIKVGIIFSFICLSIISDAALFRSFIGLLSITFIYWSQYIICLGLFIFDAALFSPFIVLSSISFILWL